MGQFNNLIIEQDKNQPTATSVFRPRPVKVDTEWSSFILALRVKDFWPRMYKKGITLLELLIAIGILGLVVIAFANIHLFSYYQVLTSDKRAKLQHDDSYVLEHMAKEISKAIGNEKINGVDSVVKTTINPNDSLICIYIDANGNGQREAPINNPPATADHWLAYRFDSTGAPSNRNQIRYCELCQNSNCNFNQCTPRDGEVLSSKIATFEPSKPAINPGVDNTLKDNYVEIKLATRWTPDQPGSPDNPEITMKNRINMPAVSTD